jgi:hypothetical protein
MIKTVGVKSNRDGIGARIKVVTELGSQIREVEAGSSYLSGHDLRVLFGLGEENRVQRIEITWPGGLTQALTNIEANQLLVVTEGRNGYAPAISK